MNKSTIVFLVAIVALIGVSLLFFKNSLPVEEIKSVTSFDECVAEGNLIMESYPRQCRSQNGELFVENIESPAPEPTPTTAGKCFVGGCSGQICSDQEGMISTCEYREEYACYKTAKCERQSSGKCGWTSNSSLQMCLNKSSSVSGYVTGHVNIGPFCPVEREGQPCKVPPDAYSSRQVIVYKSNGVSVERKGAIDTEGNYAISLTPGNYFIQIEPAGIGPGEKKSVTIGSSVTSIVNFDIDTGIR